MKGPENELLFEELLLNHLMSKMKGQIEIEKLNWFWCMKCALNLKIHMACKSWWSAREIKIVLATFGLIENKIAQWSICSILSFRALCQDHIFIQNSY